MRPSGSPSTECRSAATSPPAQSGASPVNSPQRGIQVSEISEPQPTGSAGSVLPTTMPAVEEAFDEIDVDEPLVGIIMGSLEYKPNMQQARAPLQVAGIRYELRVM